MDRCLRALSGLVLGLAMVAFLSGIALAGEVRNDTGKYDGLYLATVTNRTKDQVFEQLEIELEGRFIVLRQPEGHLRMKIIQMWDRRFQMEVTARDSHSGDLYIIHIKS